MTAQPDPYVKVYYRILEDPKFETVYGNDAALATWLRLLIVADAMFPAPAPIPMGAKLKPLVDAGLVDLLPGNHYRIHGLASERDKRTQSARNAAASRWQMREQSDGITRPNADPMPLRSAPLQADPIRSTPPPGNAPVSKKPPTDEEMILKARAVLADRTTTDEQKRIARDVLEDLGVEVAA